MGRTAIAVMALALWASSWPAKLRVDGGMLLLDCPAGWQAVRSGSAKKPTIRLLSGDKLAFRVVIEAVVGEGTLPTDAQLETVVREDRRSMLRPTRSSPGSAELTAVRGASANGYVYHFTDPDSVDVGSDYREMDRGFVVVGPLVLRVSILTHSGDRTTVKTALDVISNARYEPSHKQ